MIRVRKWSGAVWGGGLGAHSLQFSSVVAGSVGLLLLIADMERDYEKKTSLLLVDKMKKNHTGRGVALFPHALTQRAHYYQWRAVDLCRHSYEGCLKALLYTHSPSVND